jgi:hypothetical protein
MSGPCGGLASTASGDGVGALVNGHKTARQCEAAGMSRSLGGGRGRSQVAACCFNPHQPLYYYSTSRIWYAPFHAHYFWLPLASIADAADFE